MSVDYIFQDTFKVVFSHCNATSFISPSRRVHRVNYAFAMKDEFRTTSVDVFWALATS